MSNKPLFGDTLKFSIPLAFVCMMTVALLVMAYASVRFVGKALVDSERSRVSQVAFSIALELEKRQVYVEQLTDSFSVIGQSGSDLDNIRSRIELRLEQELDQDMVIGGGIWPEPFTLAPTKERASLFWSKTGAGFTFYDSYNRSDTPDYFRSLWYQASKYVDHGCFWSGAYADPITQDAMTSCYKAIYIKNHFAGVASVDVSTKELDAYLDRHMADVHGYAIILDRNLRIMAKPDRHALKRQLGVDISSTDMLFPDDLQSIGDRPEFVPIEKLIHRFRRQTAMPPLPTDLQKAFDETERYFMIENRDSVRDYFHRLKTPERQPISANMMHDPVFGEAAELFLVHMPKVDNYLVIVVPEKQILSQSTATLSGLLLIMLVTISIGVVVLWIWLRRVLLLPLSGMVTRLRFGNDIPLDARHKYEVRALATAYNEKQSELKLSRQAIEEAHKQYRGILQNSNEAIAVISKEGELIEANVALLELLQRDWKVVSGATFSSYIKEGEKTAFTTWFDSLFEDEHRISRCEVHLQGRDNSVALMEISASISRGQDSPIVTLFMRDISQRREAERAMAQMAITDSLTGLYNRAGFTEHLEAALNTAEINGEKIALLFIDLDYFKEVNDVRGHEVGDELLRMVAKRLCGRRRASDIVARLGGDEFAVILKLGCDLDMIGRICEEIVQSLNRPFDLENYEACRIGASVGVSIFPDDADSVSELVRQADIAMYQAKGDGRNGWRYYAKELADAHQQRQRLIQDMNQAIDDEQFFLEYQPIINAAGEVVFMEALIRWRHPERGLISPMDFIPLAESTGLVVEIGAWVIETACQSIRNWKADGMLVPAVSINVSVVQLQRGNLIHVLEQSLLRHQLDPSCLLLEMTESLLMDASYTEELQVFRQRGFGVAIDDFGTGYSSLGYLQTHPVDYLKIDKAFVAALEERTDYSLCRAIIQLSQGLGAKVIAEGVENAEQFWQLADMESNFMQGYWIARPMSEETVTAWVKEFHLEIR